MTNNLGYCVTVILRATAKQSDDGIIGRIEADKTRHVSRGKTPCKL